MKLQRIGIFGIITRCVRYVDQFKLRTSSADNANHAEEGDEGLCKERNVSVEGSFSPPTPHGEGEVVILDSHEQVQDGDCQGGVLRSRRQETLTEYF